MILLITSKLLINFMVQIIPHLQDPSSKLEKFAQEALIEYPMY